MICTVGHGARSAVELVSILQEAQIRTLVDVRAFPTSRRDPQLSRETHGEKVIHLLAPGRALEHAIHPQEELWRDV
ncbi:MAG: DUF488 family protein [Burkholderiales bacterium]